MYNLIWSRAELTPQKLGTFCEYYAKMALTSYGMSIYTSEVDDHGIDFIVENKKGFLKFQVKSVRQNTKYVFMRADHFDITDESLYLMLFLLKDGEHPTIYVFPAAVWQEENPIFVYHAYEGKKSKPEYGLNLSAKNIPHLEEFKLENMIASFVGYDMRQFEEVLLRNEDIARFKKAEVAAVDVTAAGGMSVGGAIRVFYKREGKPISAKGNYVYGDFDIKKFYKQLGINDKNENDWPMLYMGGGNALVVNARYYPELLQSFTGKYEDEIGEMHEKEILKALMASKEV